MIFLSGGFALQMSRHYPRLNFVIQDRGPVLKQGQGEVWPKENPGALKDGRVRFMEHDFFEENPVKRADVYWLRYILWALTSSHQWRVKLTLPGMTGRMNTVSKS